MMNDKPRWPQKWLPPVGLHLWALWLNHLSPNFLWVSYMDYFHQTLSQGWKCTLSNEWKPRWPPRCPLLVGLKFAHVDWTLYLCHLSPGFFPNFIFGLLSTNSHSRYGIWPVNDQDGHQNCCRQSVCSCGHFCCLSPNLFQISYLDYFHQTLAQVEIWLLFSCLKICLWGTLEAVITLTLDQVKSS